MVSGKTKSGFEFSISEHIVDDWRVAKAIAKSQSKKEAEQISGAVEVVGLVLGDQEEALCDHIKREDGTVPINALMDEISEIMTIAKEQNAAVKN